MKNDFKRGDIFWCDLGEGKGSVQGGIRPCMIIQNDIGNKYSTTVIVAPLSSKITKSNIPTHVLINKETSRLRTDSVLLCEQIKVINKTDLGTFVGNVTNSKIDVAIAISLGLGDLIAV